MNNSGLITISIGASGGQNVNPPILAQASHVPMRVVVRNIGPTLLFLAHDVNALDATTGPTAASYRLPVFAETVFVLAPLQRLVAIGAGAGGLASIATSDAIPFDRIV